jgi:hypothetical protein
MDTPRVQDSGRTIGSRLSVVCPPSRTVVGAFGGLLRCGTEIVPWCCTARSQSVNAQPPDHSTKHYNAFSCLETCLYFIFFIHVAKRAGTSFRGQRDHLPTSCSHVHAGHAGHAGQEDGTGIGLQTPVLRRMAETRVLHRARVFQVRTLNPR